MSDSPTTEAGRPYSKNERAGKVMGFRRTDGIAIDEPCELGYHYPVCEYPLTVEGNYDERLTWSEYNNFLWCEVCNKDYPSALCQPDIDRATETLLDTVTEARADDPRIAALRTEKADALRVKEQQRGMIAALVEAVQKIVADNLRLAKKQKSMGRIQFWAEERDRWSNSDLSAAATQHDEQVGRAAVEAERARLLNSLVEEIARCWYKWQTDSAHHALSDVQLWEMGQRTNAPSEPEPKEGVR